MAEAPAFITVPQDYGKKKNKVNITSAAIVLNSLNPTLPIVVPGAASHLEESSRSTPNSPERGRKGEAKKSRNFFKHLSRPRSPRHHRRKSNSDPESSSASPSPQPRPKVLHLKKKKSTDLNGATAIEDDLKDDTSGSYGATELEATPVEMLPGRTYPLSNSVSDVPEIRVSSAGHDEPAPGGLVSYEDISGSLDPYRKNSQSSRCSSGSGLMSVGTSGFGSLLSPSGDESSSDIESPLSPYCSGGSSFTEDAPGDSDLDPIDKDYTMGRKSTSPIGSNDNLSVTTPTPTSESPPNQLDGSVSTLVSPTSPEGKDRRKKKDKDKKVTTGCDIMGVAWRSLGNTNMWSSALLFTSEAVC